MTVGDIGVLFDLDGTLVASEALYFGATQRILDTVRRSLDELTPEEKSRIPGRSGLENMAFYRERFGLAASARELVDQRMDNILREMDRTGMPLTPGAREFVERLSAAGLRLALASSSPRRYVERVLALTGLTPAFPVVLTGDECRRYKPDPEIFLKAADGVRLPRERCVVVEDAHSGILAARTAGMRVLAVRSAYTLPEQSALADRVVPDLGGLDVSDVLALLDAGGATSGAKAE